jgi:hypothetical protein
MADKKSSRLVSADLPLTELLKLEQSNNVAALIQTGSIYLSPIFFFRPYLSPPDDIAIVTCGRR